MIEVKNLTKSFGDFSAVRDVSFKIEKKSGITALLGPNGAGKTTTLRLLTGYLKPTSGQVSVAGLSPQDEDGLVELKRKVGYLPETSPLYPEMLVSEYLAFVGQVRGLFGDALEKAGEEMIEKLELGSHLYSPIGILSKGFRQRVALAGSLIHKPEIIILDEPTSGLDPNQISQIRGLIRDLGKQSILILSTHILQEVQDICNRVIIINRGRIVADDATETLTGSSTYAIVAKGKDVAEKLKSFSIVKSSHEQKSGELPEGYRRFVCDLKTDEPQKLFSEISASGWEVREFSPVSRSLQEIFQELTH